MPSGSGLGRPICAALPRGTQTLADLAGLLEAAFAGDVALSGPLAAAQKTLVRFFDDNALQLGRTLNRRPVPTALPVPLKAVAPLERAIVPTALNGEHGSNRAPGPCRIDAGHDLDAIHSWLSLKDGNPRTYNAYKKELERLLLWAVLERGKALSSLNTDDCKAYVHFLKTLSTADSPMGDLGARHQGPGRLEAVHLPHPQRQGRDGGGKCQPRPRKTRPGAVAPQRQLRQDRHRFLHGLAGQAAVPETQQL